MLDVYYSNQTSKFLKKIDQILLKRILDKIEILRKIPIIPDSKRVEGYKEKVFRVRVGDYRILYEFDNKSLGIVKIDKRAKVY